MKLIVMFTLALCTGGMDRRNDEQTRVIIGKCCTAQCKNKKTPRFCTDQTFICWERNVSCNKKQCKCDLVLNTDTQLHRVSCNIINTKSFTCNPVTETTNPKRTRDPTAGDNPGITEEDRDSGHGSKRDGAESETENDQGNPESETENDQGDPESETENDQGSPERETKNDQGDADTNENPDENQGSSSVLIAILVTLLLCIAFFTIIIIIIIYKHKHQVSVTESQLAERAAGGTPEQVESKSKIITIYTTANNPEVLANTKPDHCYEEIRNAPPEDGRRTLYVTIGPSPSDQQIPSESAQQQEDRTYSELASTGRESSMA